MSNETATDRAEKKTADGALSLGGIGWTLLIGGGVALVMGLMQPLPSIWLLAGGGLALNAGFFCLLFAWIGGKIDALRRP